MFDYPKTGKHDRSFILQRAIIDGVKDKTEKNKFRKLLTRLVSRTQGAAALVKDAVNRDIHSSFKEDMDKVQTALIAELRQKQEVVLSSIAHDVKKVEEAVATAESNSERIHYCLEKIAEFAKIAREFDSNHPQLSPKKQAEVEALISELRAYGIKGPTKWQGKLAKYDNPIRMLSRYEDLWEKTRAKGIAAAIRAQSFALAVYRVKKFNRDLKHTITLKINAIQLNFIGFKNWLQRKLGGGGFEAMTQSTHLKSVHASITQSVARLQQRYPEKLNVTTALTEIEAAIKTATFKEPQSFYRKAALDGLKRIKNATSWKESNTGLTLAAVTALMWRAVHDQPAFDQKYGVSTTPEREINDRVNTFLEFIWRAQREYNLDSHSKDNMALAKSACLAGTFNKIVESMDQLHPDVGIARTKEAALAIVQEAVKQYYEAASDQKAINDMLDARANFETLTEPQQNLLEAMRDHVKAKLEQELGEGTLNIEELTGLLNNIEYVELPPPNNGDSELSIEEKQQAAVEKIVEPNVEAALEWAKAIDPEVDEIHFEIWKKASNLEALNVCLKAVDRGLDTTQQHLVKKRFGYAGDIDNKADLSKHLEANKQGCVAEIIAAHERFLLKNNDKKLD